MPSRPSRTWARALWVLNPDPMRPASSSSTIWPTLCLLPWYCVPGLPRPTISQVSVMDSILGGWRGQDGSVRKDARLRTWQWQGPSGVRALRELRWLLCCGFFCCGSFLCCALGGSFGFSFLGDFDGLGDVHHECLGVRQEDGALGQDQVGGVDVLAGGAAFNTDHDGGGQVGCLGLEGHD